jgi:hypothetical protein
MGTPIVALLVVVGLMLMLALFAKGGPAETMTAPGLPPELSGMANLGLPELGSVASRLFTELGFSTLASHEREDRIDLTVVDPTPVTGQTVYIRCVLPPKDVGSVQSHEVQAALDAARGENLTKAIVITPGTFSDEAKLVSHAAPLELIDGGALATLLRTHLPDVANRLGLPR